jgi:glyoxylase-like metal-dependent hydrolase (beta-lactamase superfamily II)
LRVLAVHRDVIVFISRVWQTTCTAVRSGDEGFLIDSPVYPDELEALPEVLSQAGFNVSGLLVTHADWDHLLGRLAFPEAALGCSRASAARLAAEPGAAQRELKRFDEEHYVAGRPPLALVGLQELPVPGRVDIGVERELELHPAYGHTADGTAVFVPWAEVLVCGDYLSPVEIPMVTSRADYRATLDRLQPLVARAETVVPGHGAPMNREQALHILAEDVRYLERGDLPPGRRTETQRKIHAANPS